MSRERAVTSPLAVVLLVALTVVTAAILVPMVESTVHGASPATVSWSVEADSEGTISVEHGGGPTVAGDRLALAGPALDSSISLDSVGPPRWSTGTSATVTRAELDADSTGWLVWDPPLGDPIVVAWWSTAGGETA